MVISAWIYTLIPAAAAIIGATVAVNVRPGPTLVSAIQHFAAGVVFAAAAGEALAGHELQLIPSRSAAEQGIVKWQCWSHGLAEQIIPEGCESQP